MKNFSFGIDEIYIYVGFILWGGGLVFIINRLLVNLELDIEYLEYLSVVVRNEKLVRGENWDVSFII